MKRSKLSKYYADISFRHTVLLLFAMILLMCGLGYLFAGYAGALYSLFMTTMLLYLSPAITAKMVMRSWKAVQLDCTTAPVIFSITSELARRAKLHRLPKIYWAPFAAPNAFALGNRNESHIVVTEGLLRLLNMREISGILAHEIGHIHNNDLYVMNCAYVIMRVIHFLSTVGQVMFLLIIPTLLITGREVAFLPYVVLIAASPACLLLMLALSRTREYEADRVGVKLARDALGLASALRKIDGLRAKGWHKLLDMGGIFSEKDFLKTHPPTEKRIARILLSQPGSIMLQDGLARKFPRGCRLAH